MPTVQITTIATDAGLTTPAIAVDGGSSAPIRTPETTSTTSSPSSTGVSAPTRKVSGRSDPTTKSQRTSTIVCPAIPPIRVPAASCRLPAAAAGGVRVAAGRRRDRDRDLGEAPRDREQDDPAELLAETEAHVERVRRLRKGDARDPGHGRRADEDEDEERAGEAGQCPLAEAA